jgi:hypothetical protein
MNLRRTGLVVASVVAGILSAVPESVGGQAAPPRYGHNADHTRLTGRLVWSGLEGGHWQIEYVDPEDARAVAADRYRGRFTLGRPKELADFKSGQWVELTGRVRPDAVSIYMTGTLYQVATARALAPPPSPAQLTRDEARLSAQAERMRKAGQRWPGQFSADKELAARAVGPKERALRFILIERRDGQWSPQRIDDATAARVALEQHIAADTGNYVHTFRRAGRLAQDEKIVAQSSHPLYHRFDTTFRDQDGTTWRLTYVVVRSGFLAEVVGQYTQWLGDGGKGLILGRTALADEPAFTEAADLLVRLIYLDGGPILLDRQVVADDKEFRWTGTLATHSRGPTSDRDWILQTLTVAADRASGQVRLEVGPLMAPRAP